MKPICRKCEKEIEGTPCTLTMEDLEGIKEQLIFCRKCSSGEVRKILKSVIKLRIKICPLLLATTNKNKNIEHIIKDTVCLEDECGWYNEEAKGCGMRMIRDSRSVK